MATNQHTGLRSLTTTTFDELIEATSLPVVIDFSATWCPPCGPTADALAQVAAEQPEALVAATVDVDEQPDLARRYGVQSMPTLILLRDGEEVGRLVGGRGPARLREDLHRHLDQ